CRQLIQPRLRVGFDPLRAAQAGLEADGPLLRTQPDTFGERGAALQALGTVAVGEHGALGTLAAVLRLQAMGAGRVGLVQVPLRQTVEAQQQVIEVLRQVWLGAGDQRVERSEEHTSELQSRENLVCRLLLEKKKTQKR